jgi:hypothetical protein
MGPHLAYEAMILCEDWSSGGHDSASHRLPIFLGSKREAPEPISACDEANSNPASFISPEGATKRADVRTFPWTICASSFRNRSDS